MSLARRSTQQERMDNDCADFDDYSRCLRDLSRVNTVTLTHRPMLSWLARQGKPAFSLLDIACGHGDCLRTIRKHYPNASLTGIDLNPWATHAATDATPHTTEAQIGTGRRMRIAGIDRPHRTRLERRPTALDTLWRRRRPSVHEGLMPAPPEADPSAPPPHF